MKIAFDIDSILNNLTEAVLEVYNVDSNDNLTIDDITTYRIENFVKPEYKEDFPKYFIDKRVWKKVKPVKEAVDLVNKLHEEGHEIYYITATEPYNLYKKSRWLLRILPNIPVRAALIRLEHKQLIDVDVLVDDNSDNFVGNCHYHKVLLDYAWNKNIDDAKENIIRCYNWDEIEKAIYKLIEERKAR